MITDIGQTSGGYVTGVSTLNVNNVSVTTYSATELNSTASLYYDAQTVGTLYQEGKAIQQGVSAISSNQATGSLSTTATSWDDYDLQTDHYVVAFFIEGSYYENPLDLGDGSCDDAGSDCTIGLGGGVYWITAAEIYLGSTLAHQTDIPQDGSTALADGSTYGNYFSSQTQPQLPANVQTGLTTWINIMKRIAPILFLERSVVANQNPSTPYVYPFPYLVDLVGDTQTTPSGGVAARERTYLLEDTYGRAWSNTNPVTVSEKFAYVGGSQSSMPAPNNPSSPPGYGWGNSNGELDSSGQFLDRYSLETLKLPVWFFAVLLGVGVQYAIVLSNTGHSGRKRWFNFSGQRACGSVDD